MCWIFLTGGNNKTEKAFSVALALSWDLRTCDGIDADTERTREVAGIIKLFK